jgi:hypothetical protein
MKTLRLLAAALLAMTGAATLPPPARAAASPAAVPAAAAAAAESHRNGTHSRRTRHRPTPPRRPHPHRKPWPITVTVRTVPALSGVRLTFDGTTLVTNGAGAASYTAEHNLNKHTLALLDTAIDQPTRRYRFSRWAGQRDPKQAFRRTVTNLPMRTSYTITAAFTVLYPVSVRLVDQHGVPLEVNRVSTVAVKSDVGRLLQLPTDGGSIWLEGAGPEYRNSTLVENRLSYSVQTVLMDGANIVDAARQRFTPADQPTVVVTGQLYDMTISANDALYGSALGTGARVTGPDGRVMSVRFDASHKATLQQLPRGRYQVTVLGARGVVLDEQINLSRDHAVPATVVSLADLTTVGGGLLLIAITLLLIGRRWLRQPVARFVGSPIRRLRRRPQPVRQEVAAQ